ncbi:MAG: hypothetical protein A3G57_00300 [Candidatus Andersenbacteria bacterium RIFCSPLOWO2_12_FULL_45_8]|nr:MAG: hypothetical protein A3G57_00300 [Candidatus Andersenbacteria bacterium RIFCSPLOWO2_12_FULL_45_8]
MLIIRRKKYYQQEVIYMICKKTMLTIACASLLLPLIALAGGLTPVKPFLGTSSGTLISAITKIVNGYLTLARQLTRLFIVSAIVFGFSFLAIYNLILPGFQGAI